MPSGAPMLATKATVTTAMRNDIIEKLDMVGCYVLSLLTSQTSPMRRFERITWRRTSTVLWLKTISKLRGLWCTANP